MCFLTCNTVDVNEQTILMMTEIKVFILRKNTSKTIIIYYLIRSKRCVTKCILIGLIFYHLDWIIMMNQNFILTQKNRLSLDHIPYLIHLLITHLMKEK